MEIGVVQLQEEVDFLFEVYARSRREEISSWGWTEGQQFQFLRMQHNAQQCFYRQQYPCLEYKLIWTAGEKAGRIGIVKLTEELVLVDIIVLPEFQNRGLGSFVLRELQRTGREENLPIRLSVFAGSPAQKLYERFGFTVTNDSGVYLVMKWFPNEE